MNISVQQLLAKIEDQLLEAKTSDSDARIRERVYAIKSLCELVLEQEGKESITYQHPVQKPSFQAMQAPLTIPKQQPIQTQTNKIKMAEGNGDSLFDF
ncbi:YwdI family protein [Niallia sp. Sow4_A1]|jgi:hypothetical protein|uniref:YwdI family protein n=1 Tax=Niallia hominis TaxID=3133173 RepID=A0ABV1F3T9_9BACI|nr:MULTISPECIES: YwdI family protein [Bacillaceae]MCF2650354.1 YwdI family protein [Niallia circulans]CAI9396358.1 putative protein YwdI [Bacillus sp. T2.9-1]